MGDGEKTQQHIRYLSTDTFDCINNALYVGDLDKSINEAALYQVFSKIGPIQSIRVCRDIFTRKSLGYAYVNFIHSQDTQVALKAMEMLNYMPMKGRPIRIMRAQRDSSNRKSGINNVFVKGLDSEIDSRTLHDTFEVFGPITSAKVALDDNLCPLGYGYVQYSTAEGAQAAVQRANGMLLKGKQLYVAPYLSKRRREATKGFTNVYCKNLPDSVKDEKSLKALFEKYGYITSAFIARDHLGALKGFGFVNFEENYMAKAAIEGLNNKEVGEGKVMYVGPSQKKNIRKKILKERFEQIKKERQKSTQGRNLYIKEFNLKYTTSDLEELFGIFGTITSAKVMTDENGKSKGFGFVCYEKNEEAQAAIKAMNRKCVDGKKLYVAIHQNKETRQAELSKKRKGKKQGSGNGGNGAGAGGNTGMGIPKLNTPMMGFPMMPPASMWPMLGGNPPGYPEPRKNQKNRGGRRSGRGKNRNYTQGYGYNQNQQNIGYTPSPLFTDDSKLTPEEQKEKKQQQEQLARELPKLISREPSSIENTDNDNHGLLLPPSPRSQNLHYGEKLYPAVFKHQPSKAAKITGMLLEMQVNEIEMLLKDPDLLADQVEEAVRILEEHGVYDAEKS